jgi:hypothetical protein
MICVQNCGHSRQDAEQSPRDCDGRGGSPRAIHEDLHAVRAKPVAVDDPSVQHCDRIADHFAAISASLSSAWVSRTNHLREGRGRMAKHEEFLELLDRIVARGDDVNFLAELAHRICNVRPFSYTQAEYDRLLKLCSRYDHVA